MTKKIQIIEDEASLSTPLKAVLEKSGYTVFVEPHGDKAVDAVKEHNPDLVLMDIILPGKTGWDIIESIGKDYKVIAMSSLDSPEREYELISKGAIAYLVKPNTSLDEILKLVEAALAQ